MSLHMPADPGQWKKMLGYTSICKDLPANPNANWNFNNCKVLAKYVLADACECFHITETFDRLVQRIDCAKNAGNETSDSMCCKDKDVVAMLSTRHMLLLAWMCTHVLAFASLRE